MYLKIENRLNAIRRGHITLPTHRSLMFLSSRLGIIGGHLGRVALAVHEGREAVGRTLGAP